MRKILILVTILTFQACGRSPYPGFSKGKEGIYYQLHRIGESDKRANPGDYITADIRYSKMNDSVFFSGRRKLQLGSPNSEGSVETCFRMLGEDESATFIISADNFFNNTLESDLPPYLKTGDLMKIKIDVIEIQTKSEYNFEKQAFLNWIDDFGEYEKVLLNKFLQQEKLSVKPATSGLYYLPLQKSSGKKVQKGDTVTVNYEGKFLNGKFFDSTIRRKQPFQFVYGTEWQVIAGLEEAIGMMREGEKALFIMPSELAFGTEGSSTGIIPPFTSLIFEIEILKIN